MNEYFCDICFSVKSKSNFKDITAEEFLKGLRNRINGVDLEEIPEMIGLIDVLSEEDLNDLNQLDLNFEGCSDEN
ncbi:hypothetical protein HOE37_06670 [Candidatus Woesearchaeota archaeon]|jgi:hypothetical protein|nr:hypothetical protein [Candidatus Woesearchaeota archaeon]